MSWDEEHWIRTQCIYFFNSAKVLFTVCSSSARMLLKFLITFQSSRGFYSDILSSFLHNMWYLFNFNARCANLLQISSPYLLKIWRCFRVTYFRATIDYETSMEVSTCSRYLKAYQMTGLPPAKRSIDSLCIFKCCTQLNDFQLRLRSWRPWMTGPNPLRAKYRNNRALSPRRRLQWRHSRQSTQVKLKC